MSSSFLSQIIELYNRSQWTLHTWGLNLFSRFKFTNWRSTNLPASFWLCFSVISIWTSFISISITTGISETWNLVQTETAQSLSLTSHFCLLNIWIQRSDWTDWLLNSSSNIRIRGNVDVSSFFQNVDVVQSRNVCQQRLRISVT